MSFQTIPLLNTMKKFINKITALHGYNEFKASIKQKINAEVGRVAKRYNEKQQAQQPQETEDGAQGMCNDQPQFKALPTTGTDTPTSADTKLVASPGDLPPVPPLDTLVLHTTSPLPLETEVDTADVPANQVEGTLVNTPDALPATDFGDSSNFNADPVVTVGTPQVEHS